MSKQYHGAVLFINGQPVAHAGPGGSASASEECWVTEGGKKVKKTFMNKVYARDLKSTTCRVFVNGYPIATLSSVVGKSYGDAESEGGVTSGTTLDEGRFLSASPNVFFEGSPVVRRGDSLILNAGNSEVTTWVQPAKGTPVISSMTSDPIENLVNPQSLNIELIRSSEYQFSPAPIQQSFKVTHQEDGRKVCHTYGVFKKVDNTFLWHDEHFEKGTYRVDEFYPYANKIMTIPLGVIKTDQTTSTTPGMKLVPLSFRRFDDMQHSGTGSKLPYPHSFIYLFKDSYVWRVFYVNHLERLCECDFSAENKTINSHASATLNQGVLLPIQDAEGKHSFHVMVSQLALPWEILHELGGIDPKDPRFTDADRLSISPDPVLIQKRLQKIDIEGLIAQGESSVNITADQTEHHIVSTTYAEEPAATNWKWKVERERFQLSVAQDSYPHQLYWHKPVASTNRSTPTLEGITRAYATLPGAAVLLLEDPLGRLVQTAEFLINQAVEHLSFLDSQTDPYTLALLVGQILEETKKENKSYEKHVRNDEREALIEKFENIRDSHHACMRRGSVLLKFWHEATKKRGQWEDYYRAGVIKSSTSKTLETFRTITGVIDPAFLFSVKGHQYLEHEVTQSDSTIIEHQSFIENMSKYEPIASLTYNMATLLASVLKPTPENLDKILGFFEKCTGQNLRVEFVPISLDELIAHHHAIQTGEQGPITALVRIEAGIARRVSPALMIQPSGKMIPMLFVEEVPGYLWMRMVPHSATPVAHQYLAKMNALAAKVGNSTPIKAFMGAMSLFCLRSALEQIKSEHSMGNLKPGEFHVLYGEAVRHGLNASYFAGELTIATRAAIGRKMSENALKTISKLSFAGVAAGIFLDFHYATTYFKSSEYALFFSHGLSIGGGIALMRYARLAALSLPRAWFGVITFLVVFSSALLIAYFSKNEMERWLYDGFWGASDDEKKSIALSIEQFHYLCTILTIKRVEPKDVDGNTLMPSYLNQLASAARATRTIAQLAVLVTAPSVMKHINIKSVKTLALHIQAPQDFQGQLSINIIAMHKSGQKRLEREQMSIHQPRPSNSEINFVVEVSRSLFPSNTQLGKILIAAYDIESHVFIGKDAYNIIYKTDTDSYECEKVIYELQN